MVLNENERIGTVKAGRYVLSIGVVGTVSSALVPLQLILKTEVITVFSEQTQGVRVTIIGDTYP